MQSNPACPICTSRSWKGVGVHRYVRADEDGAALGLRQRVLFEVWFPGQEQVELRSVMCRHCGFMTYVPRLEVGEYRGQVSFPAVSTKR